MCFLVHVLSVRIKIRIHVYRTCSLIFDAEMETIFEIIVGKGEMDSNQQKRGLCRQV